MSHTFYYDNIPSTKVCVNALYYLHLPNNYGGKYVSMVRSKLQIIRITLPFDLIISWNIFENLFPTTTTSRHLHTIQVRMCQKCLVFVVW